MPVIADPSGLSTGLLPFHFRNSAGRVLVLQSCSRAALLHDLELHVAGTVFSQVRYLLIAQEFLRFIEINYDIISLFTCHTLIFFTLYYIAISRLLQCVSAQFSSLKKPTSIQRLREQHHWYQKHDLSCSVLLGLLPDMLDQCVVFSTCCRLE